MMEAVLEWYFGTDDDGHGTGTDADARHVGRPLGSVSSAAPLDKAHRAEEAAQITRLRAGDIVVFEALFFEHAALLRRFVRAMGQSAAVAEEIVQDVFAHLWEHRNTLTVKTTLRAYLFAAARGRTLTALRAAGVRDAYADRYAADRISADIIVAPGAPPNMLAHLEREELTRIVRDAMASLSPRVRQAAELRWLAKLSHAEIAESMGTSPATVNNQLTTALKTLRERLRPYLAE